MTFTFAYLDLRRSTASCGGGQLSKSTLKSTEYSFLKSKLSAYSRLNTSPSASFGQDSYPTPLLSITWKWAAALTSTEPARPFTKNPRTTRRQLHWVVNPCNTSKNEWNMAEPFGVNNHTNAPQFKTAVTQKTKRKDCFLDLCLNFCWATNAPGHPPTNDIKWRVLSLVRQAPLCHQPRVLETQILSRRSTLLFFL